MKKFVYFICECNTKTLNDKNDDTTQRLCCKIGMTTQHPADRMCQLQTGNPRKLIIYRWLVLIDNKTTEEYIHNLFSAVPYPRRVVFS